MAIGPIQYIVVGFPGNKFNGQIVPELAKLIESGTVRVLDLIFVGKDDDGDVVAFEFDQLDELEAFAGLDGEIGGLLERRGRGLHRAPSSSRETRPHSSSGRTSGPPLLRPPFFFNSGEYSSKARASLTNWPKRPWPPSRRLAESQGPRRLTPTHDQNNLRPGGTHHVATSTHRQNGGPHHGSGWHCPVVGGRLMANKQARRPRSPGSPGSGVRRSAARRGSGREAAEAPRQAGPAPRTRASSPTRSSPPRRPRFSADEGVWSRRTGWPAGSSDHGRPPDDHQRGYRAKGYRSTSGASVAESSTSCCW